MLYGIERNANTILIVFCSTMMTIVMLTRIQEHHAVPFQAALIQPSSSAGQENITKTPPRPAAPMDTAQSEANPEVNTLMSSQSVSNIIESASPEHSDLIMSSSQEKTSEAITRSEESSSIESFPAFDHTSWPIGKVPNWGAMRTPEEWNRTYGELKESDFVPIPRYDLSVLTTPMETLTTPLRDENIPKITAKLFYSTRFFGSYNIDAGEWTGRHPALDLKLARGTPIGAIAGGRVSSVEKNEMYGLHVVIEHRLKTGETFYSIYGHFDAAFVHAGQEIAGGQTIGVVGMTGHTTAPHLHLQIDRGEPNEAHHLPYLPTSIPSQEEGLKHCVHPIDFLKQYRAQANTPLVPDGTFSPAEAGERGMQ